jgi:hypothetical protein
MKRGEKKEEINEQADLISQPQIQNLRCSLLLCTLDTSITPKSKGRCGEKEHFINDDPQSWSLTQEVPRISVNNLPRCVSSKKRRIQSIKS